MTPTLVAVKQVTLPLTAQAQEYLLPVMIATPQFILTKNIPIELKIFILETEKCGRQWKQQPEREFRELFRMTRPVSEMLLFRLEGLIPLGLTSADFSILCHRRHTSQTFSLCCRCQKVQM